MAKISLEMDTESKALAVKIDDLTIENVTDFSLFKSSYAGEEEKYYCSIMTREKAENGVEKTVMYHSRASEKASAALKDNVKLASPHPHLIKVEVKDKLFKDVENFLKPDNT